MSACRAGQDRRSIPRSARHRDAATPVRRYSPDTPRRSRRRRAVPACRAHRRAPRTMTSRDQSAAARSAVGGVCDQSVLMRTPRMTLLRSRPRKPGHSRAGSAGTSEATASGAAGIRDASPTAGLGGASGVTGAVAELPATTRPASLPTDADGVFVAGGSIGCGSDASRRSSGVGVQRHDRSFSKLPVKPPVLTSVHTRLPGPSPRRWSRGASRSTAGGSRAPRGRRRVTGRERRTTERWRPSRRSTSTRPAVATSRRSRRPSSRPQYTGRACCARLKNSHQTNERQPADNAPHHREGRVVGEHPRQAEPDRPLQQEDEETGPQPWPHISSASRD